MKINLKPIKNGLKENLSVTVLAYLLMSFFMLMLSIKAFDPLSNALKTFSYTDIYYKVLYSTQEPDTSNVVTIVDMTHLYRRGELAQLLEDIEREKPRVVGVDVVFESEKDDFEGNDSLISVVEANDNLCFGCKYFDYSEERGEYTKEVHSFFTDIVDTKEGFCNVPRGGQYDVMKRFVFRRCKSMGKMRPSLVSQVVSAYCGKDMWSNKPEDIKINFSPLEFRVLTPEQVHKHPEWIRDRIVLVGAMYDDTDFHWTPLGKIAGVKLLAYAAQTTLDSREVVKLPGVVTFLLSFFVTLLFCSLSISYRRYTGKSSSLIVKFLLGSTYVISIITFLFTSLLLLVCFLIFTLTNVSVNLTWSIASIAFITTSLNMYTALQTYYTQKRLLRDKAKGL